MNNENDPLLLDHEVDGIRELDNKLPRWWVWLFNITILFAAFYLVYYHVLAPATSAPPSIKKEMKQGEELKAAAMGKFEASIPTLTPSKDPAILDDGQADLPDPCAPCHRADGGGLVGPNLCDDYWIHGSNFADNVTTIWNGVPAKGMITWKNYSEPGPDLIRRQLHLHPARHASAQSQAAGKPGARQYRPVEFE